MGSIKVYEFGRYEYYLKTEADAEIDLLQSENNLLKKKLEKATDFVKYISAQGWWSTKMEAKQYSGILDEYKIESDNILKELDEIKE